MDGHDRQTERYTDRQADGWTEGHDRQTDGMTHRQINKQMDRWTDRQIGRQTNKQTEKRMRVLSSKKTYTWIEKQSLKLVYWGESYGNSHKR
jgi:hypothetical protein